MYCLTSLVENNQQGVQYNIQVETVYLSLQICFWCSWLGTRHWEKRKNRCVFFPQSAYPLGWDIWSVLRPGILGFFFMTGNKLSQIEWFKSPHPIYYLTIPVIQKLGMTSKISLLRVSQDCSQGVGWVRSHLVATLGKSPLPRPLHCWQN